MSTRMVYACVLMVAAACARKSYAPSSQDFSDAAADGALSHNRDVITHEELQAPGLIGVSVLDAVRTLRPSFLSVRGNNAIVMKGMPDTEAGRVHSSIDGAKVGPLDELTLIRASTIREIRYLSPAAAQHRFGGSAREGPVILVTVL